MCSAGAVQAGNAGVLCIMCGQKHHAVSFLGVLSGEWVFWGSCWDPLSSWWSWDLCSVGLCGTCALGLRPEMRIFIFSLFGAEPKPWVEDEALMVLSLGICMFIYSCLSGHWEPAVRAYWALFPRAQWGDSVLIYTHLSWYRNCSRCSIAGLSGLSAEAWTDSTYKEISGQFPAYWDGSMDTNMLAHTGAWQDCKWGFSWVEHAVRGCWETNSLSEHFFNITYNIILHLGWCNGQCHRIPCAFGWRRLQGEWWEGEQAFIWERREQGALGSA